MRPTMANFTLKSTIVPMRISYGMALDPKELPKLGIELLKMFSDQTVIGKLTEILHVHDDRCYELLKYFIVRVHEREPNKEEHEDLDGPKMDEFRNAFWEAIENFSGAHRKQLVQQIKAEVLAALQKLNLEESSTISLQEQESSPGTTP